MEGKKQEEKIRPKRRRLRYGEKKKMVSFRVYPTKIKVIEEKFGSFQVFIDNAIKNIRRYRKYRL